MTKSPFFSIVTACRNSEKTIRRTFDSVLAQSCKDYEYIIVDGASTDSTLDIIKEYESKFEGRMRWISEPDKGIYDAVSKGFGMSSGEVMAWLGSDDIYFPEAMRTVMEIFDENSNIHWLTGTSACISENDLVFFLHNRPCWQRRHFLTGYALYVMQEGTFWRRSLWEVAGGHFADLKFAGDYELWLRFSKHAELFHIHALLAAFRMRSSGQASLDNLGKYIEEVNSSVFAERRKLPMWKYFLSIVYAMLFSSEEFRFFIFKIEDRLTGVNKRLVLQFDREKQKWYLA